ncbi:MAG TPA: VWA domain-containing protein [Cytophagales bacterium]|nr:VWA domain-containing protein [Cytophagales bacterium]
MKNFTLTSTLVALAIFYSCKKDATIHTTHTLTHNGQTTKEQPIQEKLTDEPNDEFKVQNTDMQKHKRAAPKREPVVWDLNPMRYDEENSEGDLDDAYAIPHNTESYTYTEENIFKTPIEAPLSTFSIDVDEASYTNCRRHLENGSLPPPDAVRVEEFINYFDYEYPQPSDGSPFAVSTEYAMCPWNNKNRLLHIGIQGKKYEWKELKPMNLVFLIDVSGSMDEPNKLPLLKESFKLLISQLRPQDRVAIVVYAGAAGLVLPSTSDKKTISSAVEQLNAGGSTAGGAGIQLAYKIAKDNFIENGCNRVILATDGDFNVGQSSDGEMTRLLEDKRKEGIYLTTLGFGMGNYKDSKMESMADKGNGNNFYIDSFDEARKILVTDLGSTLYTIAKDVKIQVEFNPSVVASYRLVGYENRKLNNEDFNDDTKDAGELGAGHTVTAIYEIVPPENSTDKLRVDPLKYQTNKVKRALGNELATIKLRYKTPTTETSTMVTHTIRNKVALGKETSMNFNFSAAVASFGMLLRDSKFKGDSNFDQVLTWALASQGADPEGYRSDFIRLVEIAKTLKN